MRPRYQSLFLCLLLTVLCTLPPLLLGLLGGIHSIASFKDFVDSEIAYSGYNKHLELYIILLFLCCDFLLLPLLLSRRKEILDICIPYIKNRNSSFHLIREKILFFFHTPIFNIKSPTFGIILLGFLYLLFQTSKITSIGSALAVYSVMGTYLLLVAVLWRRPELFTHVCMAGIGCYFSLMGVLIACRPDASLFIGARLWCIPASCLAVLGIACWLRNRERPNPSRVVALAWTLTPCLLFALTRYSYDMGGGHPLNFTPLGFQGLTLLSSS